MINNNKRGTRTVPCAVPRTVRVPIFIILCLMLPGVFGCTTYNAATGKNEFVMVSTQYEVNMGEEIHKGIIEKYKFSKDQAAVDRLNRIGERVTQVSDRQDYKYTFYLVDSKDINAFTTPGGNIYFYTGLMDKLKTDDQIAAVIAHETGHCAARHIAKKFQAALGYSMAGSLAMSILGLEGGAQEIASLGSDAVMTIVFNAFSRKDEYQADSLGLKYMYLAGYNLNGMLETMHILLEESKGPKMPLILNTHPFVEDRIVAIEKEIPSFEAKYGSNSN
jgi:predicted Zn-dependent protease